MTQKNTNKWRLACADIYRNFAPSKPIRKRMKLNKCKKNESVQYCRIYLFLIVLLYSTMLHAQQSDSFIISGTIKDERKEPVELASVFLKNTNIGTSSDKNGDFILQIPAHTRGEAHIFCVHFLGYETYEEAVNVVAGKRKTIHVLLDEKNLHIGEVVISAKTEKRKLETAGFAISAIEPSKSALQSLQTNELLDRTAGVRIRQDGGLGSRVNYNINGLSGDAIKIFIDGVPASNFGAAFSLSNIPPALIERIEVYKGVVPGYLSEDALGGAVNVVLKQKANNTLNTSYSFGSFNTHQWSINGSYRADNGLTADVSAFYNYSDNSYKVWGPSISFKDYTGKTEPNQKAKRFHDAYESYGTKFNVGFTSVRWADRFLVGGVFSKVYKEVQHGSTMNNVYGDRHNRRDSKVATLTYDKKDFLLEGLSLKVDASHSNLSRQVIDTVGIMYDWSGKPLTYPDGSFVMYTGGAEIGNEKTTAIDKDKTTVARVNMGYELVENQTLYVNYLFNDFRRSASDKFQPLGLQMLKNTRDLQKNIMSFTYESGLFEERLKTNIFYKHYFQQVVSNEPYREDIVPGVANYEVEVIKKNIDYSGYGLTLSFALLPNIYLLGSAEKAIRLPNADELFGNNAENLLPPSAELAPEMSYNANIGVALGTFVLNKHSIRLNTSFYYRDTRGMIREAIRTGSFVYSQFENLENVLTKGVDAEFTYNYANKVNYSFNISKFDVLFNTEFDKNGDRYNFYRMQIRNEPSFKFNNNIAYFLNNLFLKGSRGSVYYNVNYVNSFLRNWANVGGKNLDKIPTQYPMDAGFAYTFPTNKITFSLDAKNIFNQQIFDNFGLQKPGRAFFAKITYSII